MVFPKHIDNQTVDGAQMNLDALYQICPSCFTEAQGDDGEMKHVVDWNKLRALLGDNATEDAPEVYDFTWVGKRAAQREAMAPIRKTLRPCPEESVNWDTTQNLYIEGDNLEVLKLLQNSYMGKVKMIYIDPPYNTGNDFVYHDDFHRTQREEDEEAGVFNEEGERMVKNTESNGKFHSDWCSMVYARLLVSRSLLAHDGAIYISMNDSEISSLKTICNEVFGEANFVSQLVWANKEGGGGSDSKHFRVKHEYILVYAKNIELCTINGVEISNIDRYTKSDEYVNERGKYYLQQLGMGSLGYIASLDFPIIAPDGTKIYPNKDGRNINRWRWSKDKVEWGLSNGYIEFSKDRNGDWVVNTKQYLCADNEGNKIDRTNRPFGLIEKYSSTSASKNLQTLLDGRIFDYSKPVDLMTFLINTITEKDSIVIDYFSGSATTAHAVMQLNAEDGGNRNFIMVQWPEDTEEKTEAYKAGYKNICEIGKERIRRAGKKIKEEHPEAKDLDIGFRVFKCDDSNFKDVAFAPKDYTQESLDLFVDNIKEDRSDLDLLFDCMLRWGVTLDLPMTKKKVGGCTIHNVNEGALVACFDGVVTEAVIDAIAEMYPAKVVFRDSSFEEAAQKMNIFELFKQKCGWDEQEVRNNIRVI